MAARGPLYLRWRAAVNMTADELQAFLREYGRVAGLSRVEAAAQGVRSGRDSARALLRMFARGVALWTDDDWEWAARQTSFIARMRGARGPLRDERGEPTRKLLALKLWGHDPEK